MVGACREGQITRGSPHPRVSSDTLPLQSKEHSSLYSMFNAFRKAPSLKVEILRLYFCALYLLFASFAIVSALSDFAILSELYNDILGLNSLHSLFHCLSVLSCSSFTSNEFLCDLPMRCFRDSLSIFELSIVGLCSLYLNKARQEE